MIFTKNLFKMLYNVVSYNLVQFDSIITHFSQSYMKDALPDWVKYGWGSVSHALHWSTGQYMYVDSTDTKSFQEVAELVSPMTTVPMSGCLSFQYQQDHAGEHLFSLFSRDQAGQYQELWRADLPENNHVDWSPEARVWRPVQVDLRAPYPIEVRLTNTNKAHHAGLLLWENLFQMQPPPRDIKIKVTGCFTLRFYTRQTLFRYRVLLGQNKLPNYCSLFSQKQQK